MKIEKLVGRANYSIEGNGFSTWFYPDEGQAFPIILWSESPTLVSMRNEEVADNDYVFTEDDFNEMRKIIRGDKNVNDIDSGDPIRDFNMYNIVYTFMNSESCDEICHVMNELVGVTEEDLSSTKYENMISGSENVSSRAGYSFDEFVDIAVYGSEHDGKWISSMWGITPEGNEYCIMQNSKSFPLQCSPTPIDQDNREVDSLELKSALLKMFLHLKATGTCIDAHAIYSNDRLTDREQVALTHFQMLLDDIHRDFITEPIKMCIGAVSEEEDDITDLWDKENILGNI